MKDLPEPIVEVIERAWQETHPVAIYLYGSRARDDYLEDSDYEVALLYEENKRVDREALSQLHSIPHLNLYSFSIEEMCEGLVNTPFQNVFYLNEFKESAQLIRGNDVVRQVKVPGIKLSDLSELIGFELGYALSSLIMVRNGVKANTLFSKAVFYGFKTLILIRKGKLVVNYDDLISEVEGFSDLDDDYIDLLKHALFVRNGGEINVKNIYLSMTFLNKLVLRNIKTLLKDGDKIVWRRG